MSDSVVADLYEPHFRETNGTWILKRRMSGEAYTKKLIGGRYDLVPFRSRKGAEDRAKQLNKQPRRTVP